MQWKKGFKRITLVISILVGIGVGIYIASVIDKEIIDKTTKHENCRDIVMFWIVWKDGGWDKREVIEQLTRTRNDGTSSIPYYRQYDQSFLIDGKLVFLTPQEVFPGIAPSYNDLALDELEEKAKVAITQAADNLKNFTFVSTPLRIFYNILAILAGGVVSFVSVWIIFYLLLLLSRLLKWLARGFCEEKLTND